MTTLHTRSPNMESIVAKGVPAETLTDIMNNMSIRDCITAGIDTSSNRYISEAGVDRMCIHKYIDSIFGVSHDLLYQMGRCGAYMSGSRATEFFKRGSVGKNSDIDFYISARWGMCDVFMKYMETVGVVWDVAKHDILKMWENDYGLCTTRSLVALTAIKHLVRSNQLDPRTQLTIVTGDNTRFVEFSVESRYSILLNVEGPVEIRVSDGRMTVNCSPLDEAGSSNDSDNQRSYRNIRGIVNIINGTLTVNNKNIKVQLMQDKRTTYHGIDSVFGFHSSCIQAVITSTYAAHLYHDLTFSGKSYLWKENCYLDGLKNRDAADLQHKYEERGYTYVEHDGKFRTRYVEDEEAFIFRYGSYEEAGDVFTRDCALRSGDTVWFEYPDSTTKSKGPYEARDRTDSGRVTGLHDILLDHSVDYEYCTIHGVVVLGH